MVQSIPVIQFRLRDQVRPGTPWYSAVQNKRSIPIALAKDCHVKEERASQELENSSIRRILPLPHEAGLK